MHITRKLPFFFLSSLDLHNGKLEFTVGFGDPNNFVNIYSLITCYSVSLYFRGVRKHTNHLDLG